MLDKNGVSKGSGFVAFQSPEDASRAVRTSYIFPFLGGSFYLFIYFIYWAVHTIGGGDEWQNGW